MTNGTFRDSHQEICDNLANYEMECGSLLGIADNTSRQVLVEQIVSSMRRVEYVRVIQSMNNFHMDRCNPHSPLFDPLRAAIIYRNNGEYNEAIWLAFLATHFGKNVFDGWKLIRNIYGTFNNGPVWTYINFKNSPDDFLLAMKKYSEILIDPDFSGRYSNHRKYEGKSPEYITKVLKSYCDMLITHGGFIELVKSIHKVHGQCPTSTFHQLYIEMNKVHRFGRLAKFDFLTMIGLGKLGLVPIISDSTYIRQSTGPKDGAILLFLGNRSSSLPPKILEQNVDNLARYLGVSMQVMEDALCNWQKSPHKFIYHR